MADLTLDAPVVDAPADTQVPDETPDTAAMAEALKKANAEAKKYRLEAKAHADQLTALAQQNMSDTEKAIATARAEARTEALRESGGRLVDAEIKAAAAGRAVNVEALLEGLDRTRFLDDDGEPKVDHIQRWIDKVAPPAESSLPRVPAGVRDNPTARGPAQDFAQFINRQLSAS